jgi:hypothetical protein
VIAAAILGQNVVVFSERHLRHLLLSYMKYYNGARTHLSLEKDAPVSRAVKNKYPGYISWETFEMIKAMLRDNRAEYLRTKSRGIPRDGAALLHGITWCGECGHKMVVRPKDGGAVQGRKPIRLR